MGVDFLASFAAGTPKIVLLHVLSPVGHTAGFVAEGDMQAKVLPITESKHAKRINPLELNVGIFISLQINKTVFRK